MLSHQLGVLPVELFEILTPESVLAVYDLSCKLYSEQWTTLTKAYRQTRRPFVSDLAKYLKLYEDLIVKIDANLKQCYQQAVDKLGISLKFLNESCQMQQLRHKLTPQEINAKSPLLAPKFVPGKTLKCGKFKEYVKIFLGWLKDKKKQDDLESFLLKNQDKFPRAFANIVDVYTLLCYDQLYIEHGIEEEDITLPISPDNEVMFLKNEIVTTVTQMKGTWQTKLFQKLGQITGQFPMMLPFPFLNLQVESMRADGN